MVGPLIGIYREYSPPGVMAREIRALFTFRIQDDGIRATPPAGRIIREILFGSGDPAWSALFALAEASIVVNFGNSYRIRGVWEPSRAQPHVIGPMTKAHVSTYGETLVQVGAYLNPGATEVVLGVRGRELADSVVPLEDLWDAAVVAELHQPGEDAALVAALERAIAGRMETRARVPGIVLGTSGLIRARHGCVNLDAIAMEHGVSRQYLAREFREHLGVSPKLYARLARFGHLLQRTGPDWAGIAEQCGYADQSHMIAEFREFSGLTPARFSRGPYFHPFQRGQERSRRCCQAQPDGE